MNYLSLFPGYTRSMPRFAALSEAVLRQATDLMALVPEVESGFSVAGAAGAQLDALGASFLTPRQLGWDDETYREVLRRKLKRAMRLAQMARLARFAMGEAGNGEAL